MWEAETCLSPIGAAEKGNTDKVHKHVICIYWCGRMTVCATAAAADEYTPEHSVFLPKVYPVTLLHFAQDSRDPER